MMKKIFLFILFFVFSAWCGIKEEKLPANVDFTNTILFAAQIDDKYELLRPQIFAVKVDSPHTLYQLTDTRDPIEDPVWLLDGSGIVFLKRRFDDSCLRRLTTYGVGDWQDNPDIYIIDTSGTRRIIRCWENFSRGKREKYKELEGGIFSIAPTNSGKIMLQTSGYKFIVHDTVQAEISFDVIKVNPELSYIWGEFALSPDEEEIVFATQLDEDRKKIPYPTPDSINRGAYRNSFKEVFVMRIEDGVYKRLTYNNLPDNSPCLSNDGKKIYFSRRTDWSVKRDSLRFESDIFVMDSDGKNQKNLTNSPNTDNLAPKVSPDGKLIAYISEKMEYDKYTEIWIMNNDGTNKRKVIGLHAYNCGGISWYPKK